MSRFNPALMQVAREARGLTQTSLARLVKISQPYLCQIEAGLRVPSEETLASIAHHTGVEVGFLMQSTHVYGGGVSTYFYRRRASARVRDLRRLEAEATLRCLMLERLLSEVEVSTPNEIEYVGVDEHAGPHVVASRLRASWRLPQGAVSSLVRSIELAGGVVFKFSFDATDIDAMSRWDPGLPPTFFINADASPDRIRFSLAHELGHILMHRAPSDEMERQADEFASEFLMPAPVIEGDLLGLTLERAALLKPIWRVSMAALARRARDLGCISQRRFRSLMIELGTTGQRRRESVTIPTEEPVAFERIAMGAAESMGVGRDDLAAHAGLTPHGFWSRVYESDGALRIAN